ESVLLSDVLVGWPGAYTNGGRCSSWANERLDLTGTYKGRVDYPNSGLWGDATLAINGNDFTLSQGERQLTGQIAAVKTCDYTAVALKFDDKSSQAGATMPMSLSL